MMFVLAKRCVKAIHNSLNYFFNLSIVPVDAPRFAAYFSKLYLFMTKLELSKY